MDHLSGFSTGVSNYNADLTVFPDLEDLGQYLRVTPLGAKDPLKTGARSSQDNWRVSRILPALDDTLSNIVGNSDCVDARIIREIALKSVLPPVVNDRHSRQPLYSVEESKEESRTQCRRYKNDLQAIDDLDQIRVIDVIRMDKNERTRALKEVRGRSLASAASPIGGQQYFNMATGTATEKTRLIGSNKAIKRLPDSATDFQGSVSPGLVASPAVPGVDGGAKLGRRDQRKSSASWRGISATPPPDSAKARKISSRKKGIAEDKRVENGKKQTKQGRAPSNLNVASLRTANMRPAKPATVYGLRKNKRTVRAAITRQTGESTTARGQVKKLVGKPEKQKKKVAKQQGEEVKKELKARAALLTQKRKDAKKAARLNINV